MYILSEGLFNQNNSSLARYSFNRQRCTNNYFSANNQRRLGDTANDIAIYGNKIYVVVNVSSTVEVIDFYGQIHPADQYVARQWQFTSAPRDSV